MSPQRIQQRRTKGWRKPEGAVAVGRGTKWGNPFKVGDAQVRMPALDGGDWEHEGRLHKTSGESHAFYHSAPLGEPMPVTWHQVEDATAEQCVRLFAERIGAEPLVHYGVRVTDHEEFRAAVRAELAGRDLMCWCPLDQPCHADVLLELANGDPR
ncbi:DUF4326 domain-containing protein [Brachybacterium massiliense]|uniref:DUF4326 domain-containing protein n=1 Tax=Brachybacterium massiliense TaxID=1755098 RepID=UPI000B3BD083|nr:DUF4326 domain-containing protein [Brachybacterium massiliense]